MDFALQKAVGRATVAKELGNKFFQEGNLDEAVRRWQGGLNTIMEEMGYSSKASTSREQSALELMTTLYLNIAMANLKQGDFKAALRSADTALDHAEFLQPPQLVKALYRKASALKGLKRLDDSRKTLQDLLAIEADNAAGKQLLSEVEVEHAKDGGSQPEKLVFEIRPIEGKGLGAVATCPIKKGQRIFAEKLVLQVPPMHGTILDVKAAGLYSDRTEALLQGLLAKQPDEDKASFWELHDSFTDQTGGKKTAWGIVRTNALPLGVGSPTGGVFPITSRFNHSCLPNVHHTWQEGEGKEVLHANFDIDEGDELCICYTQPYEIRADRQRTLTDNFSFVCKCPTCELQGADRKLSDKHRRRLHDLDDQIPQVGMMNPKKALTLVTEALDLTEKELKGSPPMTVRHCYDGFQLALAIQDLDSAKKLISKAFQNGAWAEGLASAATQKYKNYMLNPRSHPAASSF